MSARVLVVDDDPVIRKLVTLNLEMEGYEVFQAEDGRAALEAIGACKPDLVVCDIMMPVMDGLEVLRRIRRDQRTASLPFVLLSARAQDLDVAHGLEAGADEYVTKPFDPAELVAAVRRLLSSKGGA